ncbi:MAG: DegV family protein [Lachnospiraceae bacterium]|nr:DegV family protein [Lachnospiraceae bacterium]
MNSQKVAVIADTGCDVSPELAAKLDIRILPLKVIFSDRVCNDGYDIPLSDIYGSYPDKLPTTSTPNVGEALDLINQLRTEGYEKLLFITISSGLSSTNNNIHLALEDVADMEAHVFDTKDISVGAGFFAIWAAEKLQKGMPLADVLTGLEDRLYDSHVFFYMDTLNYLRAGGRIGKVVGIVGEALNLKPIISCNNDGIYYPVSMIRGRKNGLKKLLTTAVSKAKGEKVWLALMNGGAPEEAENIRTTLMESVPNGTIITSGQIAASLAIHTGPGLVGIGVFRCE